MASPEIAQTVDVCGVATNYHDVGVGDPVLLIHGSGPGVTAWANWRLTMPALAERLRVVAPDVPGFGYTERTGTVPYDLDGWTDHLVASSTRSTCRACTSSATASVGRSPSASRPAVPTWSTGSC